MADEVSSIGVRLTLDASGFTTPMQEASGALNTFQKQAARAASGVGQTRAGGGAAKSSAASPAAQNLTGVNVSLVITPQSLTKLRSEVIRGLGVIPVTITPQFAATGKWSIQNVMGSMLSMQYGITQTRGSQLSKKAIEEALGPMPKKAHGGPVQAGRPIVVGERRAEVFVPQSHGRVESNAREYIRQQEHSRRFEMELATLEQTAQRRHDQEMRRIRGGGVRGHGGKYGSSRPSPSNTYPQHLTRLWGDPGAADPGYLYHGASYMNEIRGRYNTDRGSGISPRGRAGDPYSYWATSRMVAPLFSGTSGYGGGSGTDVGLVRARPSRQFEESWPGARPGSPAAEERRTSSRVPRSQLQYWGDDNDWHRFRRGRARMSGGPVVEGGLDWRTQPNWRTVSRVEPVRVSSLIPIREIDREVHPRGAHDYAYLNELTEKIRAEGFDERHPVVVQYDPFHHTARVGDGNHRLAVAQRLGMETIPTTVMVTQVKRPKSMGRRMPGVSSTFPDETGYIPGSLPPSWVGLRRRGGMARHAARGTLTGRINRDIVGKPITYWTDPGIGNRTFSPGPKQGNPWLEFMEYPRRPDSTDIAGDPLLRPDAKLIGPDTVYDPNVTGRQMEYATRMFGMTGGWKQLRRNAAGGRVKHAWRGLTAEAWRQTTDPNIRGGTFPAIPGTPVPTEGNAVGIARFLSEQQGRPISTIQVDPTDPVAFMRAFHEMRKAGAPFVGTWWPDNQPIDVDPATVIPRHDEANLVADYGGEKAGYQLRRTPAHPYGFEWKTKAQSLKAEASRVAEIIYGKKRRQGGGPVFELEGMAPFLKPHVQGTVERLLGQYPMVGEHLTKVQLSRGFPPYAAYESAEAQVASAATPTSYAQPARPAVPGTLHVSAQSAGSSSAREYYTATGAMRKDKGFHIPGTSSITGNITHEVGHALRRHIEQIGMAGGLPETAAGLAELENLLKADPRILREREPGFEKFYGISPYAEQARDMPWFMGGGAFEPFAEMFSGLHTPGGKTHTIPEPMLERMSKILTNLKLGRRGGGPVHAQHGVQFGLEGMRGDLRSRVTDTIERLLDRYPMIGGSPYAPGANTSPGHPTLGYVGMSGRGPYADYGHPDMGFVPGSQGYGGRRFQPGILNFSMEAFGRMPRGTTGLVHPPSKAWWAQSVDTEWSRSNDYFDRKGNLLAGGELDPWTGQPHDRRAQFSPGTATAEGIATHEVGHAVDRFLLETRGLGSPQQWIRNADGLLIPDPNTPAARYQDLQKLLTGRAADSISGYASSARLKRPYSYFPRKPNRGDPAEPWAELFAAIETPGATAKHVRPKRMVTSIQEVLEELRGGHAATGTRRAKQAPYFLGRARKMIDALASGISPHGADFEAARDWYTIAHAQALGDMTDFGLGGLGDIGLGAYAAASPGKRWPTERAIMREILRTGGQSFPMSAVSVNVPGYSPVSTGGEAYGYSNRRKAADIIRTGSLVDAQGRPLLSGPKVVPFHGNLTGLDPHAKTLDARMSQIAGVYENVGGERVHAAFPPGWRRSVLEQAYQESFEKHGKRLGLNNFSEFQAVLWSAVGQGADLGRDWSRTKSGIAIPRHPGLVVPFHRAEGGYVESLMGSWEPWMGYQLAQEALAKRKDAKHAQDGTWTRMSKGAHTPFGGDVFHYLPDPTHGIEWRSPSRGIHHPSEVQLSAIDEDRAKAFESGIVLWPNSGDAIRRRVVGTAGNVRLGDVQGQIGIHNHPVAPNNENMIGNWLPTQPPWEISRPSNSDVGALFGGHAREGWTTTPNQTSIMRAPAWIMTKLGGPMAAAAQQMAPQAYLQQAVEAMRDMGMIGQPYARDLLTGMADDTAWRPFLDLINSGRVASNNTIWDRVMSVVGNTTGMEYLRFPADLHRTKGRPKGMELETWKRFPKMMENKVFHMAGGGQADGGLYIVGEVGPELFVPQSMAHLIPKKVMDQIPKAAGGMQVIGQKPNSLFAPPEDGIIIPNRLMDQIPHAIRGADFLRNLAQGFGRSMGATPPQGFPNIEAGPMGAGTTFEPSGAMRGPFGSFVPGRDLSGSSDMPAWERAATQMLLGPGAARPQGTPNRAAPPPVIPMGGTPMPAIGAPPIAGLLDIGMRRATGETIEMGPGTAGPPPPGRTTAGGGGRTERVVRVFVTNWPAGGIGGGGGGGGGTRVRQAGPGMSDADFQGQFGGTPTEEGTAPGPRAHGVMPESEAALFAQRRQELSFAAQAQAARTPRGMSAVLGAQYFGGRDKSLEHIAAQRRALSGLEKATTAVYGSESGGSDFQAYKDRLDDLVLARADERGEIQTSVSAMEEANPKLKDWNEANKEYTKSLNAGTPGLAATARNFAGIMVGVQLYSMAMQGVGVVMAAASPVVERFVDQIFNYQAVATKTTTAMGEQVHEARGNIEAIMAQTAASAGLSASMMDYVANAVTASAMAKAAGVAQAEAVDLFRTTLSTAKGEAPEGLIQGYGGFMGSAFLGEFMGGKKGFSEQIAGGAQTGGPLGQQGNAINTAVSFLSSTPFRNYVLDNAKQQGSPMGGAADLVGGYGDYIRGLPVVGEFWKAIIPDDKTPKAPPGVAPIFGGKTLPPGEMGKVPGLEGVLTPEGLGLVAYFKDLSAASDRGAKAVGRAGAAMYSFTADADDIAKATKAAYEANDPYSMGLAQQGVILRDASGAVIDNGKAHKQALEDMARGRTIIEPKVWAEQNQRQLKAQQQANALQTQRGITVELPYEMTKQLLMNPLITPGAGFFPGSAGGKPGVAPSAAGAGLSKGVQGMAQQALGQTAGANVQLQQIADQGLATAREQIVNFLKPEDLKQWDLAVSTSQTLSGEIARLSSNMSKLNMEASQASWGNQIRLARRALGDAIAMQGKAGGERMGYLQREQWMISRASQALNLALQQRQITTQVALAGFQAPGETGEERYMRQKEKLAEAGIAQKQLGYSKSEYTVAGEMWTESAKRAAIDAQKAIDVMTKARDAEGYAITAQETIAKKQMLLAHSVGVMDKLMGQATGNWQGALSAAASGVGEFSGAVDVAVKEIYTVLGYTETKKGWVKNPPGQAAGLLGVSSMPSQVTFGEAGTEAVAILKNPRMGSIAPEGGGGGSLTVNINGPVVRNDRDIHDLAQAVAHEVEKSLSRKGQMLGLRSPAY